MAIKSEVYAPTRQRKDAGATCRSPIRAAPEPKHCSGRDQKPLDSRRWARFSPCRRLEEGEPVESWSWSFVVVAWAWEWATGVGGCGVGRGLRSGEEGMNWRLADGSGGRRPAGLGSGGGRRRGAPALRRRRVLRGGGLGAGAEMSAHSFFSLLLDDPRGRVEVAASNAVAIARHVPLLASLAHRRPFGARGEPRARERSQRAILEAEKHRGMGEA
jgi:hypothetical protein